MCAPLGAVFAGDTREEVDAAAEMQARKGGEAPDLISLAWELLQRCVPCQATNG